MFISKNNTYLMFYTAFLSLVRYKFIAKLLV